MPQTIFISVDSADLAKLFVSKHLPYIMDKLRGARIFADSSHVEGAVDITPNNVAGLWPIPARLDSQFVRELGPGIARVMTKKLAASGAADQSRIVFLTGGVSLYELQRQLAREDSGVELRDCKFINIGDIEERVGAVLDGYDMPCDVLPLTESELSSFDQSAVTRKIDEHMTSSMAAIDRESLAAGAKAASLVAAGHFKKYKTVKALTLAIMQSAVDAMAHTDRHPTNAEIAGFRLVKVLVKEALAALNDYSDGSIMDLSASPCITLMPRTRFAGWDKISVEDYTLLKKDLQDSGFLDALHDQVAGILKQMLAVEITFTPCKLPQASSSWILRLNGKQTAVLAATAFYVWWSGDLSDLAEYAAPAVTSVVSSFAGALFGASLAADPEVPGFNATTMCPARF